MDSSGSGQWPVAVSCKHDNVRVQQNESNFLGGLDLQYETFTPWTL